MQPYERLEVEWARYNGLDPAGMVACASGTAALHLALEALQLPPGSEVLVPDYTMVACARAASLAGLTPVFVDCGEDLLLDPVLLASAICPLTQALLLVHVYGRRCESECWDTAGDYLLPVVEDLAEAHGVRPHPETDAACWSFYQNKVVAGEEGGAVWFRDPAHAALARRLRCLGFDEAHTFRHCPRGHNYRLSNCHASLVLASLAQVEHNLARRREIESWYNDACPPEWRMPPRDVPWVYDINPRRALRRTCVSIFDAVRALREAGIEARHAFAPMHGQEEYRSCRLVTAQPGRSVASEAYSSVLYLPLTPGRVTPADAVRAFAVLRSLMGA